MSKIDKTRDRLKLDNLDKKDRKDLFEKFVGSGGEVLKEKNTTVLKQGKQTVVKRNLQNNSEKNSDENSKNYFKNQNDEKDLDKLKSKDKLYISKSYSFMLWLNAFINGVVGIGGKNVNYNFIKFIDKVVVTAMIEMENIIFNALNPPAETTSEAIAKRKKIISLFKDPDDTELLERIKDLYDENKYRNILRPIKDLNINLNAENSLEDIKAIFKPIYILHIYSARLKMATEHALNSYAAIDKISKSIISSRIVSFKKDIDIVFEKYYPKLLILLKYAAKIRLETSNDLNNFLDITEEDVLGYYTIQKQRAKKSQDEQIENIKDTIGAEKKEEQKQNKIVAIGLKLMDKLVSFKKEDNGIINDSIPFFLVEEEDKVYRTKILFDTLDKEYSPLFISSKVKYNVIYDHQTKTDYQIEFNNSFLTLGDIQVRLIEYSDLVKNIQKIEGEHFLRFEQRTAMITDKNAQKSYLAKSLKSTFLSIISPLKKNLDKLLLDKSEREKFIENPNEILSFDKTFGRERNHLQGYTVIKALTEAYYYISALYYLTSQGELSGAGILIDAVDKKNTLEAKIIEKDENVLLSSTSEIKEEKNENQNKIQMFDHQKVEAELISGNDSSYSEKDGDSEEISIERLEEEVRENNKF